MLNANRKGLARHVAFYFDDSLPRFVIADQQRLQQLIVALTHNSALIFNTENLAVSVKAHRHQQVSASIFIVITDNGLGDNHSHLPAQIAEREFENLSTSMTIATEICQQLEGNINLSLVPEAGNYMLSASVKLPLDTNLTNTNLNSWPLSIANKEIVIVCEDRDIEEQITFNPGFYTATSMLHDGRIISVKGSSTAETEKSNLMVMRPDGTKEMLFYKSEEGIQLIGKGRETENDEIYLLGKNEEGLGKLYAISYNNPLKSRKLVEETAGGDFIGMSPLMNGRLLVCYRESKEASYGLFELDPHNMKLVKSVFYDSGYKTIEAVAVQQHKVPKKIPSEVNMNEQTGLLLCQDINFIGFHQDTVLMNREKAMKIEILGLESSMGTVDVEKDGSVYLKIKADTPFQLQTINEEGAVVNGPSSWITLRPNERRACVGCHQGNEVVPHNRQPLSVLKEPIQIPREPKLLAGRE